MYAFDFTRPASVADAVAALKGDADAKPLAGGMTLIPTLKQRLAQPTALIDLGALPDLKGIRREGDTLIIGAMTRHADVAASDVVKAALPALAALADGIGDAQVRHRGTLGGSIVNHDPAADYPSAVLGLGATVVTDRRQIAADDFFTGLFATALDEGEIVTEVRFPLPKRAAYVKFPNPASRYAVVGVFVAETAGGVRVAVTGAGPGVFRATNFEAALNGSLTAATLNGVTWPADDLNSDIHASAEYRAHLIGVLAKRAVAALG